MEPTRRSRRAWRRAGPPAAAETRVAELEKRLVAADASRIEAEERAELLEKQLADQPPAPPAPPPQATPTPAPALDPGTIRDRLAAGDPAHFTVGDEREMIRGRRGKWYVIRLLKDGNAWDFPDRQFVLPDAADITRSAARLNDRILRPLTDAKLQWQLFARGTADTRRVVGTVGREISFLPRMPDGAYSARSAGRYVPVKIDNEELPTLRADWLRSLVKPVLGATPAGRIEILENPPQPGHGRSAELVLYVDW